MFPGIVVINPGFIRADSKVETRYGRHSCLEIQRERKKKKEGKGRKEKVANFQRSVVSFKTSAVTIISGFRSFPFLFHSLLDVPV